MSLLEVLTTQWDVDKTYRRQLLYYKKFTIDYYDLIADTHCGIYKEKFILRFYPQYKAVVSGQVEVSLRGAEVNGVAFNFALIKVVENAN